jgi:elongation factor 1 alpha-like protein
MKNDNKQSGKDRLNLIVVGHVDAGKSTLMGHLLTLLGDVNERTIQKYQRDAEKIGKGSFAYAWVLDETEEERDRGVTMNVAITKFETEKREIFLLDSPGHKDFITHMITGAFQADAAILVVNAKTGDFETGFDAGGQTREHTLLIRSLGIQQLIVAVNKLDIMNWSMKRFEEIKNRLIGFLTSTAGFSKDNISFIPCSGLTGENLVKRESEALNSWYSGNSLIEQIDSLETVTINKEIIKKPFRMAISDYYSGGFGGANITVNGRIESGSLQIGQNVLLTPSNEYAQVKSIMVNFEPVKYAITGDNVSVGIVGPDILQLSSKSFLSCYLNPVPYSKRFQCKIILFDIDIPITIGFPAIIHHQHITEQMHFTKLIRAFNKNGTVAKEKPKCLTKNYASAIVQIKLSSPICAETFAENKNLGRFVIRSEGKTIAAGIILNIKKKGERKSKK